jgi:hypothetical protein
MTRSLFPGASAGFRDFLMSTRCISLLESNQEVMVSSCYKRQWLGRTIAPWLRPGIVTNCSESLCVPRVFNQRPAVKICYRGSGGRRVLAQNVSAVEPHGQPLTHRMPVTFNGDRLFRGRTA